MALRARLGIFGLAFLLALRAVSAEVVLNEPEIRQTLRHGPWPPGAATDPSNRVSGDAAAISLGQKLFSDADLSADGTMSCASCHIPGRDFTDGKERAQGRQALDRNTQSLWNVAGHRWFGWAGGNDNLWAQSLAPLFNADELALDPASLQAALAAGEHRTEYEAVFGAIERQEPIDTSINIAKALAAYIETLTSGKTSFDRFRDALERGDTEAAAEYPVAAQRGLQIFLGRGNCVFCHSGPAFTNGEFHDAGVPYFLGEGRVDPGRHAGLKSLRESPYTLAGAHSDDPAKSGSWTSRNVRFQHADFGIFRVPSLRRVVQTAPYMHNGSLPDLRSVLDHYNEIDMERLHSDGEAILKPLQLNERELLDLQTFLETLSDDAPDLPESRP